MVERQFTKIVRFFEDEVHRSSLKTHNKKKYKKFIHFHSTCYEDYLYLKKNNLIKNPSLGEGADKIVFESEHFSDKVIKLYKTADAFDRESEHYKILLEFGLENLVPRMAFYSQYSIVERAAPVQLDRVPRILFRIVSEQLDFGIIDDRILMLDLGGIYQDAIRQNLDELRKINRS